MLLAIDYEGLALLIGALSAAITGIITVIRTGRIHQEVKTMNELTIGQLGEANETRRIEQIPPGDRTAREDRHMHTVPEQPVTGS